MAVRTRVEPINRDVELIIQEDLSPQARSKALAHFAREQIDEAKATNKRVLGRVPPLTISVDGRQGALLESVKPDGTIFGEFELVTDALSWISDMLTVHSPQRSGRYIASHTLFADGVEIEPYGNVPVAEEYVFMSTVPYARKIERGSSSQAPEGVYQVVAVLARRRFGNVARISYGFRTALGGSIIGGRAGDRSSQRNPAIIVSLR